MNGQCCICFEEFEAGCTNNCCTTSCGHAFHTGCLLQNAMYRSECPMCRTALVEASKDEDSDDEWEESVDEGSEEEYDTDDEAEESSFAKVTVEQVTNKMQSLGFTMQDVMFCWMGQTLHPDDKQNKRWKSWSSIQGRVLDKLQDIMFGDVAVDYRDVRTYAEVLVGGRQV